MKEVELNTIWTWTCTECHTKNYTDGEAVNMSAVVDSVGAPVEEGEYVLMPNTVLCTECLEHFYVKE